MIDSPPVVLVYGHEHDLIETRRRGLQQAGFHARTMTCLSDGEKATATQPNLLLILCHSLSMVECEEALAMAHLRLPGMKDLVLMGAAPACKLGQNDELMNSFDGPNALIATINRLLRSNSSARQPKAGARN